MPQTNQMIEAELQGLIETHIQHREQEKRSSKNRSYSHLHPSEMGQCLRKMQYRRYEEEQREGVWSVSSALTGRLYRLFETGHWTQARWAIYWQEIGVLRGIWKCNNPLCYLFDENKNFDCDSKKISTMLSDPNVKTRIYGLDDKLGCFKPEKCLCGSNNFEYCETPVIDNELNVAGNADLILDFRNFEGNYDAVRKDFNVESIPKKVYVCDIKTINTNGWNRLQYENKPSFPYKIQLQIYSNILGCDGGLLIYEYKDDSTARMFFIENSSHVDWPVIVDQCKNMKEMAEAKDGEGKYLNLLPPPRPQKKTSTDCTYCEYKKVCHSSIIWSDPERLERLRKKFYKHLIEPKKKFVPYKK